MRITIETEAADALVLDTTGADRDREEAIRRTDRRILFDALKGETEFRIRQELERGSAARTENQEPGTKN